MKNTLLKLAKNQKGVTVLVLTIIISAVILIISLSMGLSSISENQISLYQNKSGHVLLNADGCAEEALTRLNRNNSYLGEILIIDNTSCSINVTGSGATRTITVAATNSDYTKNLQINVAIFPIFTVTSWEETTT